MSLASVGRATTGERLTDFAVSVQRPLEYYFTVPLYPLALTAKSVSRSSRASFIKHPPETLPGHYTNSSGARLDHADARFHEARDLVLDLGRVPQPALELVRDGARAHLRSGG